MKRRTRFAAVLAVVAALSVSGSFAASSQVPATNLTPLFAKSGVDVQELRVMEVGGIVIIRGRSVDATRAANASLIARNLGYSRVANLIRVVPPADDQKIERIAERELMIHRGLEGSDIRIESQNGIVSLRGTVSHELQKDAAVALVRSIDGVREVRSDLSRR